MKQPLFTFLIPAFNGEPFLRTSMHSLINDRILENNIHQFYEIIIIDDGSTDNTFSLGKEIAKEWNKKTKNKDFIKVIRKNNGHYGSVINRGIKEANGLYFKVLDVDDTFHISSLIELIKVVNGFKEKIDVIFTDHTFEKVGVNTQILQGLSKYFTPYEVLEVNKVKWPKEIITMHSIIYRTELLRDINYEQVEGIPYTDSQYSMIPLGFAKTMYYLDIPLYRYYIGRHEQSINLKVMIRNREAQLRVMETLWKEVNLDDSFSKNIKKYYIFVLRSLAQWQIMLAALDPNLKGQRQHFKKLLKLLKQMQPKDYYAITNHALFWCMRFTNCFGMKTLIKVAIKIYSKFKKNILAEWD